MINRCLYCYDLIEGEEVGPDYHKKCSRAFFGTDTVPILEINENNAQAEVLKNIAKMSAIPGVQSKLSLVLNKKTARFTLVGYPANFILKLPTKTYPFLPEYESLTMRICFFKRFTHRSICFNSLIRNGNARLHYASYG